MAKKKSAKKPATATGRVARKEAVTAEQLKSLVERLREQSMRIAGLSRGMSDAGVATVIVDGQAMLIRGLNQIDNFADNCARAVREAKSKESRL